MLWWTLCRVVDVAVFEREGLAYTPTVQRGTLPYSVSESQSDRGRETGMCNAHSSCTCPRAVRLLSWVRIASANVTYKLAH